MFCFAPQNEMLLLLRLQQLIAVILGLKACHCASLRWSVNSLPDDEKLGNTVVIEWERASVSCCHGRCPSSADGCGCTAFLALCLEVLW